MKIPIINISQFDKSEEHQFELSRILRRALIDYGFFYLMGHGISKSLQDSIVDLSHQFFSLGEQSKLACRMELAGKSWRGYFPVGNELTSGKTDLKEGYYFGEELASDHKLVKRGIPLHGSNIFPAIDGFQDAVLEYIEELTKLGHKLSRLLGLSLNLGQTYFSDYLTKNPLILFRMFHYPALSHNKLEMVDEEIFGVGAHTDYGLLTILKQDDCGGLEIHYKGSWVEAPYIENSFICNIGDMLELVTGGLYKSTLHRVKANPSKNRYSFPFFFDPGFDCFVRPLPGFDGLLESHSSDRWDSQSLLEFEGTYGEYITQKVSKVFPRLMS